MLIFIFRASEFSPKFFSESFKGRQRLRQNSNNLWEQLNDDIQIGTNSVAPRARTFSYGKIVPGIQEKKLKEKVFSVTFKCEKGPPGEKGLPGIDGGYFIIIFLKGVIGYNPE